MSGQPVACKVVLLVLSAFRTNVFPVWAFTEMGLSRSIQNLTQEDPVFSIQNMTDIGSFNITVTARRDLLNSLRYVDLSSEKKGWVRNYCIPLSAEGEDAVRPTGGDGRDSVRPTGGDGELAQRSVIEKYLPLASYCARLTPSCDRMKHSLIKCRSHPHRVGLDVDAWEQQLNASVVPGGDTGVGPTLSAVFEQHVFRFPKLLVSHNVCANAKENPWNKEISADGAYLLHTDCVLAYNKSGTLWVQPGIRFCRESRNCRLARFPLPAMTPQLAAAPARSRPAGPSLLLVAGLPLLAVAVLAAAGGGALWLIRGRRRAVRKLPCSGAAAAARDNGGFEEMDAGDDCRGRAGSGGGRVLLLHLASSPAERAAVRRLAAALTDRGLAVIDSDTAEWRRAARRHPAAPAHSVLLLSSPAAVAAVGGGGGGERGRLLAAAVRWLAGDRRTADYGRLFQARLTPGAPTVAGLVPGAVYTLPQHQPELVAALLAGTSTSTSDTKPAQAGEVSGAVAEMAV